MKFSERIGKRSPKMDIQLDTMDIDLRNGLWNVIELFINEPLRRAAQSYSSSLRYYDEFFHKLWFSYFKEPTDRIPSNKYDVIKILRNRFFEWNYLDVYDYIDFIAKMEDVPFNNDEFIEAINLILKRELSGYRIINGLLAPIINDNEILEIENAINKTSFGKLKGVHIHLQEALNKIADRKNPDYRNSIKESISAIESICQIISNDPKAELGKALKVIKDKIYIHGALEQSFFKLYGYTSDSDGIRHALLEDSKLDQEDALFMLISCSAFVNYLIVKSQKSGLDLE